MKKNFIIKQLVGTLVFFLVLFISAGRINFWQGWVYVAVGLVMFFLGQTTLKIDDELAKERSKPGVDAKKWDKIILGLSFLSTIGMFVVAGLDVGRYHWSPVLPSSFAFVGIILTILGQYLFLVAQKQNKFFSSVVRIQRDRGHTVCDSGLYKIVRHPAYLGSVIQSLGFPLLFGSLWSIIPVIFSIILLFVRTSLEDKSLINELEGYSAYTHKTRYKIIPYIY